MQKLSVKTDFAFPAPENGACDVLIIAGEHSGDEQAARMLKGALSKKPDFKACAFGGEKLSQAGAQVLFDMTSFSVVGLAEVLKNYFFFKKLSESIIAWIVKYKPKAVCFVDYPGLNLHIAAELKKRGVSIKGGGAVKTLYYISPQIWAWKAGRRFKMAKIIDELALIFPFEKKCYADTSLSTHFVGHPFLDSSYQNPLFYDKDGEVLLLAGSRAIAVSRIFPRMVKALRLLPKARAVALYPTPEILEIIKKVLKDYPDVAKRIRFAGNNEGRIGASAAMMSSGTMSLSCSLAGIPGAIIYVANPLTYFVGRALVKVKYLSIANILLDRPAWREFIQFAASAKKIAGYISSCLSDKKTIEAAKKSAEELNAILHSPPKMSAADWLIEMTLN